MSHHAAVPAAHGAHDGHAGHHGFAHVVSIPLLLSVFFALLGLTFLTVFCAGLNLGRMEIWVSMGIATVKGALVVLFFMHMLYDKPFNAVAFISSLIFLAVFLSFAAMDTMSYQPQIEQQDYETIRAKQAL